MIVHSDSILKKEEIKRLVIHKPENYIKEYVKRKIAESLAEKLIPFIQIEEVDRMDEVQYLAKMVIIGSEDFFRIRGMLKTILDSNNTPAHTREMAREIDHIIYTKFNNLPADQVLPMY